MSEVEDEAGYTEYRWLYIVGLRWMQTYQLSDQAVEGGTGSQ